MEVLDITISALQNSLLTVLQIARVVIPIMIVMQLIKDFDILNKISRHFKHIMAFFKLPPEAAFPLLIGMVFGLTYGAGVIISYLRDGKFTPKHTFLIVSFLAVCHAAIEDTFLFAALGANGLIVFLSRFLSAALITYLLGRSSLLFELITLGKKSFQRKMN